MLEPPSSERKGGGAVELMIGLKMLWRG